MYIVIQNLVYVDGSDLEPIGDRGALLARMVVGEHLFF
jgi:hypothetical protein